MSWSYILEYRLCWPFGPRRRSSLRPDLLAAVHRGRGHNVRRHRRLSRLLSKRRLHQFRSALGICAGRQHAHGGPCLADAALGALPVFVDGLKDSGHSNARPRPTTQLWGRLPYRGVPERVCAVRRLVAHRYEWSDGYRWV